MISQSFWYWFTDVRVALSENNLDSGADEIDLHGLYVKEAIDHTEKSIIAAQNRGDHQIRLIVGKVQRRFPQASFYSF